jgi:hypothetical protein
MRAGLLHARAAASLIHTERMVEQVCRLSWNACRPTQLPGDQPDHSATVPQRWALSLVAQAQEVRHHPTKLGPSPGKHVCLKRAGSAHLLKNAAAR